ncbi:MAG: type III pantothenate kinase [Pseudomonadota bacterium]
MLLLIDVGNTRLKWALTAHGAVAPGNWAASGNIGHEALDQLGREWQNLGIDAVLVSNVAGVAMRVALDARFRDLSVGRKAVDVAWFASQAHVSGVRNRYREPHRLGCDRLAAMIGARSLHPGRPLLVATCGTATTIDVLTADGEFIGGMILPGLGVMADSLAQRTAQLPSVSPLLSTLADLAEQAKVSDHGSSFADNTEEAIVRGCLAAQAGAIERAAAAHANARCILAGGAAAWVLPCLRLDTTLIENLVLIGLHAVAIERADGRSGTSRLYP